MTRDRPRSRRRARAPYDVVLTAEGRSHFERLRYKLRERTLPDLLREVAGDPEDPETRSAYAEALNELRRIESILAQAHPVVAQRDGPDQVSLGDRIRIGFLDAADADDGSAEELVLVHPFEARLDRRRISVVSPLGAAVLGHRPGEVVEFDTPTGRRAVRILARAAGG
jgi:transcription elongation GreA/GreB family factor